MKTLLTITLIALLVSCKKEQTCVCEVTYNMVNDSQIIDNSKITTNLGKVTKKEAKMLCRDKKETLEYTNFTVEYNYNCELK